MTPFEERVHRMLSVPTERDSIKRASLGSLQHCLRMRHDPPVKKYMRDNARGHIAVLRLVYQYEICPPANLELGELPSSRVPP